MGTNLSQVFVSNALTALSGTTFNSSGAAADDVGVWKLDPTAGYVASALYTSSVEDGSAADGTDAVTIASPLWTVRNFQVVQRTLSGNWIATPLIASGNVKRITYTDYTAWVGHKVTCVDATFNSAGATDGDEYNFKFIIRTTPTNQTQFYNSTSASLYSNVFPLGAFNTTNHKAINMSVTIADVSDADNATNLANIQAAIADHPILKDLVSAADVGTDIVITSLHPGLKFELLVQNLTQATDPIAAANTGEVVGSGNDWQVADDEARCRGRYGNFNRMYFPQDVTTYVTADYAYDKIVIEYEHNWPNSTGIAPAGALNQAVIYFTNEGTDPGTTGSEFATLFGFTDGTDAEFAW